MVCVQECHYDGPSQDLSKLEIENYEMISKKSTIGPSGGIVIYAHSSITCNEIPFFDNTSKLWEGVSVKLSSDSLKNSLVVHTVYRPPREKSGLGNVEHRCENHDIFIQEFQPYLQKIKKTIGTQCYLVILIIIYLKPPQTQWFKNFLTK